MNQLSAMAYELREDVIDMIVGGKSRAYWRRHERYGDSDRNLFRSDEYQP